MKRTLTCTVLAVLFGLHASLAMAKAVSTPENWDYLQPDRDQVIASLNVVEHPVYDVWVKDCTMRFPGEEGSAAPAASPARWAARPAQ